jgi:hypothetical protein
MQRQSPLLVAKLVAKVIFKVHAASRSGGESVSRER